MVLSHLSLLFVVDNLVSELVKEVGVPVKYPLMRLSIIIVLFHLFNSIIQKCFNLIKLRYKLLSRMNEC